MISLIFMLTKITNSSLLQDESSDEMFDNVNNNNNDLHQQLLNPRSYKYQL